MCSAITYGCDCNDTGGYTGEQCEIAPSGAYLIHILDFAFDPKDATITVGTMVVWTNLGDTPHSVESMHPDGSYGCINDDSTTDDYDDTCSSYYNADNADDPELCTGYNTETFDAPTQCCICGGGDKAGPLDSELLTTGETYSYTFDTEGTYAYRCGPHENMTATITVVAP